MRVVVFRPINDTCTGAFRIGSILDDGRIADLTPEGLSRISCESELLKFFDLELGPLRNTAPGRTFERTEVTLVAPVPRPGKVICVGLNYRDHAEESGLPIPESPIIFSKFPTSITGPDLPIKLPHGSSEVDYEAELAVIIGRRASRVSSTDAMDYVFGYANFNDVSARDFQFADGQWQRGKSCDTFGPLGPFVLTRDEVADPHDLRIRFRLNGETLQDSNTGQMIFRIPELIEFISGSITLEPGDVIATGTPPGVGFARSPKIFLRSQDIAEVEIEGLGVLRNPIVGEEGQDVRSAK
ncbi:MAG: 5-carboxymethyl-2-hydroxymuconate delta-isomerase [Acidobacteria bacterium OLB17]|nr:MAG: 5-carboxymethyl-2-hydroxymuconate delta-isomerase [Acidobacteria bacterium OLB17]MCZ2392170.1 fumarylacetoacetate hydrolase family protein [Acidobacteriota bacterium]